MFTSQTLAAAIDSRGNNCFDALRLFAATMVVFRHAFGLPTAADPTAEPVVHLLGFISAGGLGVATLFFLSGLLIADSWLHSPNPLAFASHRIARIWPGLVLCVVLTAYLIAPINAPQLAGFYGKTDVHSYVVNNALLFGMQFDIPGIFAGQRYTALNGSLWTLPAEVVMYGVVLVLGCLGLLRSQWMAVTVAAVLALSLWKIPALGSSLHLGWELVRGMLFFLAGIAAHYLRQHIKIAPAHALLFWIPVFLVPLPAREGMFYLAWIATMLAAGTHLSLARRLVLRNDYSYGVYLYGFPLQQTLVHFFPSMGAAENFLVAFPAALALAVFSWHTVESPMLRLVRRRGPGPNMSLAEQWGASSKALALAAGLPGAAVLMSVVCAAFMPLA